ncbi:UDP-N-acetylmuramoylalanyl-D-glutamate--2,6-diaminopimelate ligase [Bacillus cereus]|nr:UDP-N-acetylmuramoylalanyl-D-glutamate--2,6-diaminopimelate ligase [Bacillus cereus]
MSSVKQLNEGEEFMCIKKMLFNYGVKRFLLKARYGIEKENRQVDLVESLTETSKSISYIQFNAKTVEDMINNLAAIHEIVDKNKMLWPLISKC